MIKHNRGGSKHYLNKHTLLREIHRSKMSYCYCADPDYDMYDNIVSSISEINDESIEKAKERRVERINAEAVDQHIQETTGTTRRRRRSTPVKDMDDSKLITVDDIQLNELVFRVMTDEHIPEEFRSNLNFRPFKHYIIFDGELVEVARSHWKGTFDDGEFCSTHGQLTDELCRSFIKLAARCGSKSNVRNYSYNDEMCAEARINMVAKALRFDEQRSLDKPNPFAYYTSFANNEFRAVLNSEKNYRNLRDRLLEESGNDPSISRQIDIELGIVK